MSPFPILAAMAISLAQSNVAPVEPGSSAAARRTMAEFGRCVARRSPAKAHKTLNRDFRTAEYRNALLTLAKVNQDCMGRGRMRAGGLLFAAAIAEAMLVADPVPLNVRLLRAARTDAPTYAPTDKIAMCVARSDPDGAARLLTAPIAAPAEDQAAAALKPAIRRCAPPGTPVQITPAGMRAFLATASYRLLAASQPAPKGNS